MVERFSAAALRPDRGSSDDKNRSSFVTGAIFGVGLGVLATLTYQFFHQIIKQPPLVSKAVLSDIGDSVTNETRALFIATENLVAGIEERRLDNGERKMILHAGYRNFRESWARDFGFAALGLLALEEYKPVRDTLEAFLWRQTSQGQLPVKLKSMNVVSRFMHSLLQREQPLEGQITPKYITGHRTASLDGQALLVIAACTYVLKSKDRAFALEHWKTLQLSMTWLESFVQVRSGLLYQHAFSDWADSVAREGVVLYTNVVYWKAVHEMANLARFLGFEEISAAYRQTGEVHRRNLVRQLWREDLGYFTTSERMENISSAGNLLAIAWGLAEDSQANAILNVIQAVGMAEPVPTQAAYPAYSKSDIAIENRLAGISNYHTNGAWLWIGAWHLIALAQMARIEEMETLLSRIAETIVSGGQVYEVYGPDGEPLSSVWYSSESPLTWSAGMVVYAFHWVENFLQETNIR